MADNFPFTPGSGRTGASDDISGVDYPRFKLIHGADGVNDGDVSNANPLPAKITDGTRTASVRDTGSSDSLNVAVVDASGAQITSFGAGAEYTEGDTDSSITGKAFLWEDASETLRAVSVAKPLPVQLITALPAGTNNIGDVDVLSLPALPAGTNNIGDVDVLSLPALPAGTNNIGDVDVLTLPSITGTVTANAGTGTFGVQDNASLVDDAAFTPGTSRVVMIGAEFDDTTPDSVNEGDGGALRMSANRNLFTTIRDAAGNERGVNVNASNQLSVSVDSVVNLYTEDAASAADPVGRMLIARRRDSLLSLTEVSADGDNIALNATNRGEIYVKHDDYITVSPAGTFTVRDDASQLDDAGFTPGASRIVMVGAQLDNTTPDGVDEGDGGALRMSANRNLFINIRDAAGNERGANVNGSNQLEVAVGNTVTVASHAVTNAGTFAVQVDGAALTSLQLIDDVVIADDAAFTPGTTKVLMVAGTYRTSRDNLDDNDGGAFALTQKRAQLMAIETPAGDSAMDDTNDAVRVNIVAGTSAGGTSLADGDTYTTSATAHTPIGGPAFTEPVSHDSGPGEYGFSWACATSFARGLHTVPVDSLGNPLYENNGIDSSYLKAKVVNLNEITLSAIRTDDGAGFTPGTSTVMAIGARFDDTSPDSVDENDVGIPRMSANRVLYSQIRDASGSERGVNVDSSNRLTAAVTNLVTVTASGDAAHDAADTGNPVKIGTKSVTALPAAVSANNDRADALSDLIGRLLVSHIPPASQVYKRGRYTSAQTGTVMWDPTSGKKIAITHLTIGTGGTTAARVTLWFGANADTTYTEGTDQVVFDGDMIPSANAAPGVVIALSTPIFCQTADHELHITTSAGITISVDVYGYEY